MEKKSYQRIRDTSLNAPISVHLQVNNFCNHSCFYCSSGAAKYEISASNYNSMGSETALELADKIATSINPYYVVFTGGEPTLSMEPLSLAMDKLNKKNIPLYLNTNLTALNGKDMVDLALLLKRCNTSVLASLPHFEESLYQKITAKDDLNIFYTNLKKLTEHKIKTTINMVVHKLNYNDVYETGKSLYENHCITNFAATPLTLSFNNNINVKDFVLKTDELMGVFRDLIRLNKDLGMNVDCLEVIPRCSIPEDIRNNPIGLFKRPCTAGSSSVLIDYLGFVRPCPFFPELNDKSYNILQTDFGKIWDMLKPFREHEYLSTECRTCDDVDDCNGGCIVSGLKENNSSDPRIVKPIIKTRNEYVNVKLEPGIIYSFNEGIKFRKEERNSYTFFNGQNSHLSSVLFVTKSLKDFCETIKNVFNNYFTLEDIVCACKGENDTDDKGFTKMIETMDFLLQKNFIYRVTNKN